MTPEEMIALKKKVLDLSTDLIDIRSTVNNIKLLQQQGVQSNKAIPPGISCRIAYDSKGLILSGESLKISDIPELPIDKISGLRNLLDKVSQIPETNSRLAFESKILKKKDKQQKIEPGTGIKVNIDEDGRVTSFSDLLLSDIPILPITHIENLEARLDFLGNLESKSIEIEVKDAINPGTHCRITYDSNGRVVGGSRLTIDDIPIEVINRLNIIEGNLSTFAGKESVDTLLKEVKKKVDSVGDVTPGIYTKLKVNRDGLILSGDKLTLKDLPEINIKDIPELDTTLRKKADQSSFVELSNIVSSLIGNGQITEIALLKTKIGEKVSKKDISIFSHQIETLQRITNDLSNRFPNEYSTKELQEVKDLLCTLEGRITVIEQKLNIEKDFCKLPEEN